MTTETGAKPIPKAYADAERPGPSSRPSSTAPADASGATMRSGGQSSPFRKPLFRS